MIIGCEKNAAGKQPLDGQSEKHKEWRTRRQQERPSTGVDGARQLPGKGGRGKGATDCHTAASRSTVCNVPLGRHAAMPEATPLSIPQLTTIPQINVVKLHRPRFRKKQQYILREKCRTCLNYSLPIRVSKCVGSADRRVPLAFP